MAPPDYPVIVVGINLIFLFCSSRQASHSPICSRSLSPHSPRMDKTASKECGSVARGQACADEGEVREKGGAKVEVKGSELETHPVGAGKNFLLQVSEAHLALYPDDDGDTYVSLFSIVCCLTHVPLSLDLCTWPSSTPMSS